MNEAGAHPVLDASALIALVKDESGAALVEQAVANGAVISAVNYAEVLTSLGEGQRLASAIHDRLVAEFGLGRSLPILPLDTDDAVAIAALRPLTRSLGLSLGDRACLATARRLGAPVLTADRAWATVDMDVEVRLIR